MYLEQSSTGTYQKNTQPKLWGSGKAFQRVSQSYLLKETEEGLLPLPPIWQGVNHILRNSVLEVNIPQWLLMRIKSDDMYENT